jgi:guanylate kinase
MDDDEKGIIFIVSGPTGSGKTTLVHKLMEEFPHVVESVSCTTRAPRSNEIHGRDYYFVTKEEFKKRKEAHDFLEYNDLFDASYGTLQQHVFEKIKQGEHVILTIDVEGALSLKGKVEAVFVFIMPPSAEELRKRLYKRETETKEDIEKRLTRVHGEIAAAQHYDYCVENEFLDEAYDAMRSIIIAEEHKIEKKK